MTTDWQLDGTYFEACTCTGACPCLFGGDPTEKTCDALVAWHIQRGHFEDTRLDGLSLAMALHAPGNMTAGGWKVVVYVDDTADARQKDALVRIFGGQAGGHPAALAAFVGEVMAVESVPLAFTEDGRRLGVRIGDRGDARIEAIEGQGGGEARISGHPVAVSPGNDLVVANSQRVSHRGHGIELDVSHRVAYYAPFQYAAA